MSLMHEGDACRRIRELAGKGITQLTQEFRALRSVHEAGYYYWGGGEEVEGVLRPVKGLFAALTGLTAFGTFIGRRAVGDSAEKLIKDCREIIKEHSPR